MGFGFMAWIGLLGLIGIPILIIIYILKPKFQEKKVSSTYIWKLSLKYRKRKIPLQWLKSLLLVVQCIIVAILAMLLAKPYVSKAMNSYDYRKIVIIDSSASMMTIEDGKSRFNRAIDKACEIAETATIDNSMTVIMCAEEPVVVADNASDPGNIQRILKSQEPKGTTANYGKAIAQAIELAGGTEVGFTLITDHDYADPGFFEVINVSQGAWNMAVDDAWQDIDDVEFVDSNNNGVMDKGEENKDYLQPIFRANYFSYNEQLTIIPCAEIHFPSSGDVKGPASQEQSSVVNKAPVTMKLPAMTLQQMEENTYAGTATFDYQTIRKAVGGRFNTYKSIRFYAEDENGQKISDAFTDDDEYYVMADGSNEKFNVLLMGNEVDGSLKFLENMFQAVSSCYVEKVIPNEIAPSDVEKKNEGFDLYVYDGCLPTTMPIDGAVLFINPPANGDYSKFGFSIGQEQRVNGTAKILPRNAGHAIMTAVTEVDVHSGAKGVFAYTKYTQATTTDRSIATLVTSEVGSSPLIFTGETSGRVKFTVFAFDLVYTDFPLVFENYAVMIQNIISNSTSHTILNGAGRPAYGDYSIGEQITVNVEPNTTKLEISVGEGQNLSTKVYDGVVELNKAIVYTLERGGKYTITQTLKNLDGTTKTMTNEIFVRCNSEESNFAQKGGILTSETVEKTAQGSGKRKDLIYKYFAGALIALLLIEWGLQYREQY